MFYDGILKSTGYEILGDLGRGGMGRVYRARCPETGRIVALKTVTLHSARILSAIRREIEVLSKLNHPGIIRVFDRGIIEGRPWYVMEYVEGLPLDDHFRNLDEHRSVLGEKKPLGKALRPAPDTGYLHDVLTAFRRICSPLAFLHGEGIVHRDLKPANIFIRKNGLPVIMDFGLFSYFGGTDRRDKLVSCEAFGGTQRYMAPEQLSGKHQDARTDIYSLGCILYELITGFGPGETGQLDPALPENSRRSLVPPVELTPGIPPALNELMIRMLEPEPHDRIGYALDIASRLEALGADNGFCANAPRIRIYLHRSRFAGRNSIFSDLDFRLTRSTAGCGSMNLIGGESGIGKTRLAAELAIYAGRYSCQVLNGECRYFESLLETSEFLGASPFQPLISMFQTIAEICVQIGEPEASSLLGPEGKILAAYSDHLAKLPCVARQPEPPPLRPDQRKKRILDAATSLFQRLSRYKPLLVIFDDLQWADSLTQDLLAQWTETRFYETCRICILGTYRTEELTASLKQLRTGLMTAHHVLDRLDTGDVATIITDMLGGQSIHTEYIRNLARLSEGNPFYVAEFLMASTDSGILYRNPDGQWQVKSGDDYQPDIHEELSAVLPRSIHSLMMMRLALLDSDSRLLACYASVIGRETESELLELIARENRIPFAESVQELLARQILEETVPGRFRFYHDQIRETAYGSIDINLRRKMHGQVAGFLETQFETPVRTAPGELARHWDLAGNRTKAARYCYMATIKALEGFARKEADYYFKRYLSLQRRVNRKKIAMRKHWASEVLLFLGQTDQAVIEIRKVVRDARKYGYQDLEAQALCELISVGVVTNDVSNCHRYADRALQIAERTSDYQIQALVHHLLAQVQIGSGQMTVHAKHTRKALRLYRKAGDLNGEMTCLVALAVAQMYFQKIDQAKKTLQDVIDRCRDGVNPYAEAHATGILGTVYRSLGNLKKAGQYTRRAMELWIKQERFLLACQEKFNLGMTHYLNGCLDDCITAFNEVIPVCVQYKHNMLLAMTYHKMGNALWMKLEPEESMSALRKAIDIGCGIQITNAWALPALAEIELHLGNVPESKRLISRAIKTCPNNLEMVYFCHAYAAKIYAASGCLKKARDSCARVPIVKQSHEDKVNHAEVYARTGEAWIILGDYRKAEKYLKAALRIQKACRFLSLEGATLVEYAKLMRLTGRGGESVRPLLARSERLARETGARYYRIPLLLEKAHLAACSGKSGKKYRDQADDLIDRLELKSGSFWLQKSS
ncbi:protein kinase [bacterium]|nr:protein kinase [candidate division CSSED10-310 bacterium]